MSQAVEAQARGGDRVQQVATVITRLEGGAGILALRGAMTLDADAFGLTLVTGRGGPGGCWTRPARPGSGS